MNDLSLSENEKIFLLELARKSITNVSRMLDLPTIEDEDCSPNLQKQAASFVTITRNDQLRGCIGAIEAYQPLAEDVIEHAAAAATRDYRFEPVRPEELNQIEIEISVLTPPKEIDYEHPEQLIEKIKPGIHGVILRDGIQRATFLPQVWKKLPDPAEFLSQLCRKMGSSSDLWRKKRLIVQVYEVIEFCENK